MAVKLDLKKRGQSDTIRVSLKLLQEILDQGEATGKDRLWEVFANLKETNLAVYDKTWLETLVNWMPTMRDERGRIVTQSVPLTEKYKWFRLIRRVANLDDEYEGRFTLSQLQADLLWQRLTDGKFEIFNMPLPFLDFLLDFQDAIGKQLPEIEIETEDKDEKLEEEPDE